MKRKNSRLMAKMDNNYNKSGVDKSLVAMFLKMSPEERLISNDNSLRAILELRNGHQPLQNIQFD